MYPYSLRGDIYYELQPKINIDEQVTLRVENEQIAMEILKELKFLNSLEQFKLRITYLCEGTKAVQYRIEGDFPDRNPPHNIISAIGRTYVLYLPMTVREILEKIRLGVISLMTHEIDENIEFKGCRIFDPHFTKF